MPTAEERILVLATVLSDDGMFLNFKILIGLPCKTNANKASEIEQFRLVNCLINVKINF